MELFCLLPFILCLLCLLPIAICNPDQGLEAAHEKKVEAKPTIVANASFDAAKTAKLLNDATMGKSVTFSWKKEEMIMELVKYTNEQRQQALTILKKDYNKDLLHLMGNKFLKFTASEMLLFALIMEPAKYDVWQLSDPLFFTPEHKPNADIATEILITRNNEQIKKIRDVFNLDDYINKFNEYFKIIFQYHASAERDESNTKDEIKAKEIAEQLKNVNIVSNKAKFIELLVKQNAAQMSGVMKEYNEITGKTILSIVKEMFPKKSDATLRNAIRMPLPIFFNKSEFFAIRIENSMEGRSKRVNDLIRLIVSRSEIDLANISDAYATKYERTLMYRIKKKTSGTLRNGLIALITGNMPSRRRRMSIVNGDGDGDTRGSSLRK